MLGRAPRTAHPSTPALGSGAVGFDPPFSGTIIGRQSWWVYLGEDRGSVSRWTGDAGDKGVLSAWEPRTLETMMSDNCGGVRSFHGSAGGFVVPTIPVMDSRLMRHFTWSLRAWIKLRSL